MAEYLSPGVYVEEYDASPRSIEGVGTSTAGFVGLAEKGPVVGAPELITSFVEFNRKYGGYLSEQTFNEYRYLAYAVEQFFVNGGTRCFVARVVPENAEYAQATAGLLRLKAANPGKWADRLVFQITDTNRNKMQIVDSKDEGFIAKNLDGFNEGDIVKCGEEYNRIATITGRTVTFEQPFSVDIVDSTLLPKTLLFSVEADVVVKAGDEAEKYENINMNIMSPNFLVKRLAKSEMIRVEVKPLEEAGPLAALITGVPDKKNVSIALAGGSDGSLGKITADTFLGTDNGPGKRSGLAAFLENDICSIMAIPGITIPEVIVGLVNHCELLKSRFAVLDAPRDLIKTNELIAYREIIDTTYAAIYHPWPQIFDRLNKKPCFVPPSGSVTGVFSRTDIVRGVHKAPANESVSCTGLSTNFNTGEQDILNPAGINLIRQLPGQGIRVWGARTCSSNSNFKYVNVRRLFIFVEESIKAATNWVVFEPNDTTLWGRVQLTVSGFLETLWRAGMLAGASAGEAFFVEIGAGTMTRDDIMNGRLICNIGIAPSRPAEFVIFRITQHTAEAGGGGE